MAREGQGATHAGRAGRRLAAAQARVRACAQAGRRETQVHAGPASAGLAAEQVDLLCRLRKGLDDLADVERATVPWHGASMRLVWGQCGVILVLVWG